MTQQKILAAIDGSEYSSWIVDKAIEQARLIDAKIILVHCHRKFSIIESHAYREEEMAHIINEADKLVGPFLRRIENADIEIDSRIMEEPAAEAITEIARIEKCELIVLGTRGLTNLAGFIVGSVTNRVLQTAPCSVLVVR